MMKTVWCVWMKIVTNIRQTNWFLCSWFSNERWFVEPLCWFWRGKITV